MLFDSNLLTATFLALLKLNFFHLKHISKLRPILSMSNAEMLINAFMISRLDYCNALLGGCSTCLTLYDSCKICLKRLKKAYPK